MKRTLRSYFGLIRVSLMIAAVFGLAVSSVNATDFSANAGTLGPIPDGGISSTCGSDGTPLDVTFTVTGMPTAPSNVEVSMTFNPIHTWRADLGAVLIAPNGTQFTLYKYIGATTALSCGGTFGGNDFSGPYNFKDSAAGTNIWSVAATPTTPGDYRTTAAGGAGQTNPAPVTNLSAAFAGIPTSNGTWILRMTDGGAGDTGSVSAATLTLTAPTAAGVNISGRVLAAQEKRGLRNATVVLTNQSGVSRTVMTGPYGNYSFEDVDAGQTYVISVISKRFTFSPRVIQVTDNIADFDFMADQ